MLEKQVEKALVSTADVLGGVALKFVSPGRNGVPDRIVLLPVPEEHRAIVARYIKFVEVKRPGQKARPLQERFLQYLRDLGFEARVTASLKGVADLFTEEK